MGALLSPGLLGGQVGLESGEWSEPLTGLMLNVIAFMIGAAISLKDLHRLADASELLLSVRCGWKILSSNGC